MIRVQIKSEQAKYDNQHDVLHVMFPPADLSIDDEDFPGIIVRRSVRDDRITGLTILDFSKRKEFLKEYLPRYDFSKIPF